MSKIPLPLLPPGSPSPRSSSSRSSSSSTSARPLPSPPDSGDDMFVWVDRNTRPRTRFSRHGFIAGDGFRGNAHALMYGDDSITEYLSRQLNIDNNFRIMRNHIYIAAVNVIENQHYDDAREIGRALSSKNLEWVERELRSMFGTRETMADIVATILEAVRVARIIRNPHLTRTSRRRHRSVRRSRSRSR